ncbi:periplasmic protein [compost metagenome]
MKKAILLSLVGSMFFGAQVFAEGSYGTSTQSRGATSSSYQGDTDITRAIRQQISRDSSLSAKAKNVSVVTRDGKVTLKGVVENSTEKTKLDSLARGASGSKTVDNQIVISE